ncbi:unnamed protein product [Enterobius vermicularis]|uniref:ShKT domain-containing protein n=1 Tax=Enterobius vermicularis TaxID=51028 RepID=A0A0N4UZM6_ENTVE|nr:unnamed protein product [Enterobius vermicularis]
MSGYERAFLSQYECICFTEICLDKAAAGRVSDCPRLASLCNNNIYSQLMTEQCPRTCNRCNGLVIPNATIVVPTVGTCVDKAPPSGVSECQQKRYLCNVPVYQALMRDQCPRTCNFC